jgi:uncharacterized protein YbjT (DUF2867 family)
VTRTVLVTGASGFIGKFVVPALAKEGCQVRAAARDPSSIVAKPGIEIVAMPDLKDAVNWAPLLDRASHVVHLAGIAHSPGMLPDEVYSHINADSVGALAKAAEGRMGVPSSKLSGSLARAAWLSPCSGPQSFMDRASKAIFRASPRLRKHRCPCPSGR